MYNVYKLCVSIKEFLWKKIIILCQTIFILYIFVIMLLYIIYYLLPFYNFLFVGVPPFFLKPPGISSSFFGYALKQSGSRPPSHLFFTSFFLPHFSPLSASIHLQIAVFSPILVRSLQQPVAFRSGHGSPPSSPLSSHCSHLVAVPHL